MEKFAIDLDRVLDEFEFNEDRAEQVASNLNLEKPHSENLFAKQNVAGLTKFVRSTCNDGDSSTHRDPSDLPSQSSEFPQTEETMCKDSSKIDETIDIRKSTSKQGNADSVNDFYNVDRIAEKKVPRKRCVDFRDGEPVPLTFRNDISQKLVQKKQNEGEKNHNSYDKKLNQPNIKPSVSNVFSSLNEYINAPSGNLEQSEKFVTKHGFLTTEGDTGRNETNDDPGWHEVASAGTFSDESSKKNSQEPELCSLPKYQNVSNIANFVPGKNIETEKTAGNFGNDGFSESTKPPTRKSDLSEFSSSTSDESSRMKSQEPEVCSLPVYQDPYVTVDANSDPDTKTENERTTTNIVTERISETKEESTESPNLNENLSTDNLTGDESPRKHDQGSEIRPLAMCQNVSVAIDSNLDSLVKTESENIPENVESQGISESTISGVESEMSLVKENVILEAGSIDKVDTASTQNGTNSYENIDIPRTENKKQISSDISLEAVESKISTNVDLTEKLQEEENAVCKETSSKAESIEKSDFDKSKSENRNQSQNINSSPASVQKVIGFNSAMESLSDDQLNQYLAELEAESEIEKLCLETNPDDKSGETEQKEESSEERVYENIGPCRELLRRVDPSQLPARKFSPGLSLPMEDEDENEAPIFETVTIGVLPTLCEETFQEKAKKFPVLDYSGPSTINFQPIDHVNRRQFPEPRIMEKESGILHNEKTIKKEERRKRSDDEKPEPVPIVDSSSNLGDASTDEVISTNENSINKTVDNAHQESNPVSDESLSNYVDSCPEVSKEENQTLDQGESSVMSDKSEKPQDGNHSDSNEENAFSESSTSPSNFENSKHEGSHSGSQSRPLEVASGIDGTPSTTGNDELLEVDGDDQQFEEQSQDVSDTCSIESNTVLGKQPPFWIPDQVAPNCMLCDVKFTVIKRRHHCRACGKVLCNKCCSMKYKLEYQGKIESRVCLPCYQLLTKAEQENESCSSSYTMRIPGHVGGQQGRQPNPSNPMEYCSTIPPLQQLTEGLPSPPTVMVPVGVLKREGSTKQRPEGQKSVMFSDGIRPGCDLTELDTSWDLKPSYRKIGVRTTNPGQNAGTAKRQNVPPIDPNTNCYIPHDPDLLPPTVTIHKGEIMYHETVSPSMLYKSLKSESEPPIMFAINRNLYAYVKITNLNCCVNRICWNVTSRGLACVGQDEVILLVETLPDETQIPKDLLIHINQIYTEAIKGNTITDLGVSIHQGPHFLGSREHAGCLFIRQTFQCLQKIILPPAPFLVGLLVHRWETPWAKVFPLRLMLRLGAEYRYYPCPLVSVRFRDAVYFEIGHTIMKVLADFRNFAYTLPGVRGMMIHMQDRTTDVLLPKNRYDQVIKGLNNSNDHVLAFAANFSIQADSHLVCIQTNNGDESNYQTQAININNKPRKITGSSFIVINGALKSSMGLSAKSSIVEDGLMVQIMPEKMEALKTALKNMQDFSIGCGLQGAPEPDETVNIKWVENDVQFNLGVKSPIDGKPMDGVPSIRVHNGTDYMGTSRFIRWTEVFILKSDDHPAGLYDPVDINKLSESIAKATCAAFVKLLDLLATGGLTKIAVRATIHPDNVGYEAGSEGTRLPPIYMNSLDNELIQVLHKAAQMSQDTYTVLELIFHVLDD